MFQRPHHAPTIKSPNNPNIITQLYFTDCSLLNCRSDTLAPIRSQLLQCPDSWGSIASVSSSSYASQGIASSSSTNFSSSTPSVYYTPCLNIHIFKTYLIRYLWILASMPNDKMRNECIQRENWFGFLRDEKERLLRFHNITQKELREDEDADNDASSDDGDTDASHTTPRNASIVTLCKNPNQECSFFHLLTTLPLHTLHKIHLEAEYFQLVGLVRMVNDIIRNEHLKVRYSSMMGGVAASDAVGSLSSQSSKRAQQTKEMPSHGTIPDDDDDTGEKEVLINFSFTETFDASTVSRRRFTHPQVPSDTFVLGSIANVTLIPKSLYRFQLYIGGAMGHYAVALQECSPSSSRGAPAEIYFAKFPSVGLTVNTAEQMLFDLGIRQIHTQKTTLIQTLYELPQTSSSKFHIHILWKAYDSKTPSSEIHAPIILQTHRVIRNGTSFSEQNLLHQFAASSVLSSHVGQPFSPSHHQNLAQPFSASHQNTPTPLSASYSIPHVSHSLSPQDKQLLRQMSPFNRLIISCNIFGFRSYLQQTQMPRNTFDGGVGETQYPENVLYCPLSVHMLLSLLMGAAGGSTLSQMSALLAPLLSSEVSFPAIVHGMERDILDSLLTDSSSKDMLQLTNLLYINSRIKLIDEYAHTSKECYNTHIDPVDFDKSPEAARMHINTETEKLTHGRIHQILTPDVTLGADTALVLVNTFYYKGEWKHQFNPQYTTTRRFNFPSVHKSGNAGQPQKTVEVQMMRELGVEHLFGKHVWKDVHQNQVRFKSLLLPFRGNSCMIFFLPEDNNLDDFGLMEQVLCCPHPFVMGRILQEQRVQKLESVEIPKFKLNHTAKLKETMESLGMTDLFSAEKANISNCCHNLDSFENLYVTDLFQQTTVEVNEVGAEASAASAAVVGFGSASSKGAPSFVADRPFVCCIATMPGVAKGNIAMFDVIARVMNPIK